MPRPRLLPLLPAFLLLPLGCDSGNSGDGEPDVEGVYEMEVSGRLEGLFSGSSARWPETVPLEWPEAIELELVDFQVERVACGESCWCPDDTCLYGDATIRVGETTMTGTAWQDGRSVSVLAFLEECTGRPAADCRAPVELADPTDCSEYWTLEPYWDFQLEDGIAQGKAFAGLLCHVPAGGGLIDSYNAYFRADLSGSRREPAGE
jgi:hypothetical protein